MIKGLPRKACGIRLCLEQKRIEQRQGGHEVRSWGYVALKINLYKQNNMVEYCTIRILARMPVFWLMRSIFLMNFDEYDHQVSLLNQPTNFSILLGRLVVFYEFSLEAETHQSEESLKSPFLGEFFPQRLQCVKGRIYTMSTCSSSQV